MKDKLSQLQVAHDKHLNNYLKANTELTRLRARVRELEAEVKRLRLTESQKEAMRRAKQ